MDVAHLRLFLEQLGVLQAHILVASNTSVVDALENTRWCLDNIVALIDKLLVPKVNV